MLDNADGGQLSVYPQPFLHPLLPGFFDAAAHTLRNQFAEGRTVVRVIEGKIHDGLQIAKL